MDIILLRVDKSLTWRELEGFMGCLEPARRRAVMKKKTDGDRINALLSRLLVLSELSARTGLPQKKLQFALGTHGKPRLKGSPAQFSLSHTRGAVCAAFSDGEELGVDVERGDRRVNEAMYGRVLSDEEMSRTASSGDFLRFWVQKEAFLKRLGIGITRDMRGVNSLELPDTTALERGGFLIGVSGKGALGAEVRELPIKELLDRYILKV
ncbi:MAG: 4'-phosphopantetheinyl transferase superfamily protein [Lachnospiraceae bacterium]|nr:4'-phosphopantetheinyl transferase superfamily protein [Ruminococcus sp.]MCM1276151.1 4'-phosphopantetheinyl transferase superfamily protein [Lachnospiraceae bacterium]